MADHAAGAEPRYWAFISYSHKDAAFGRRLHRRLESYSLPRRLVGRSTAQGVVPRRLVPIFRDREELPAATDLSTEVRAALALSRSLIVVCSPDAPGSQWVSREVELFRALHPDRPVLAALRDGDPAECFPESLFRAGLDGTRIEPLAADFRARHDGAQLGLLKLVAGITGLGLDELVQRDAQRNRQRVMAITAGAVAAMLAMGVLTAEAVSARREAERQRAKAEGLVEYMLTDLRDRLKGVGRLDVMTAVNQRALGYYADQNLSSLPAESLERRARILQAMGEDDDDRGDHNDARSIFTEAQRTTAELLKDASNDPERVFNHAQSVYWIGEVDYQQRRFTDAAAGFRKYRELANRMIALSPRSTKYRVELAYADGDLCSLLLNPRLGHAGAIPTCAAALADSQRAASNPDPDYDNPEARRELTNQLMNGFANLADAYWFNNDYEAARAERNAEEKLLDRELAADPKNMDLKDTWIVIRRALARLDAREGHIAEAESRLQRAITAANEMARFDPTNDQWARLRKSILKELAELHRPAQ